MRAQKTKTEVRREQIARAALGLICRNGFDRLQVAGVAREVGVVPSAIYRHFQSKDGVVDAVLDLISERLLANVEAVRAATPDPLERLHELLLRHVQLVRNEIPIPRVVFSEQIFTGHPRRRRRVHRMFQQYLAGVAELIGEGQQAGRIRRGLEAGTLSVMFLGLVQPAAILWLVSDGEFNLAGHAQKAWRIFTVMIGGGEEAPAKPAFRLARTPPSQPVLTIRTRRVYDQPSPADGRLFLVDRLWPRGVKKSSLRPAVWLKDVAPSDALRRRFGHDPARWAEFRRRYFAELDARPEAVRPLFEVARGGGVTLLYSARDTERNNAVALRDYLVARAVGKDGGSKR